MFFDSANGRGGRTPDGPNVGSRHQVSSNRRGSQNRVGVTRLAQNPFTFVSFDYTQLDRRRGGAINSAVSTFSLSVINATTMLLNIVTSVWNLSMDALNMYGAASCCATDKVLICVCLDLG